VLIWIAIAAIVALTTVGLFLAFAWRVVVDTNKVHIVQSGKQTISYGAKLAAGNVYYRIPSFIPIFGVTVTVLPVDNFDLKLEAYPGYDKDRAEFLVDVVGFFRIDDTNVAAGRVGSFDKLKHQLELTMQGAVRTVLAKHHVEQIMVDRATFGEQFTLEVTDGLKEWGVVPVKHLELMDIRDAKGSTIITDIMAKKASVISMQSRVEVAKNKQVADIAEIEAEQQVEIREQEKTQLVGQRTADQERQVGIAKEKAQQDIKLEAKTTMERSMEVLSVETQRKATIAKDAAIVKAEETKATGILAAELDKAKAVTEAEGHQTETVLIATGKRDAALLAAEGIKAEGEAKGAAELALLMAPVSSQIELAQKIAELPAYQKYLVDIRGVEKDERVGIANADALKAANIKVIANSGDAPSGLASIGDLFGSSGGLKVASMLEGFANTEAGAAALASLGVKLPGAPPVKSNGAAHN